MVDIFQILLSQRQSGVISFIVVPNLSAISKKVGWRDDAFINSMLIYQYNAWIQVGHIIALYSIYWYQSAYFITMTLSLTWEKAFTHGSFNCSNEVGIGNKQMNDHNQKQFQILHNTTGISALDWLILWQRKQSRYWLSFPKNHWLTWIRWHVS